MEQTDKGFEILKWFVDLNTQAKAVIAILCMIIIAVCYNNYNLNDEIKAERIRYDTLTDKYTNGSKDCKKIQDSVNAVWFNKYEDYRNLREAELKALTKQWEARYNNINKKITIYERNN